MELFGCGEILCPSCGMKTIIENKSIELNANNIEYPKHFADLTDEKRFLMKLLTNI